MGQQIYKIDERHVNDVSVCITSHIESCPSRVIVVLGYGQAHYKGQYNNYTISKNSALLENDGVIFFT